MDGIDVDSTDESFVWLRLKPSFFSCDKDKVIGCAYFSHIDSSYIHNTNTRTDYFIILAEQVEKYNNSEDIFLCGDLNSRTGQLHDFTDQITGNDAGLSYLVDHEESDNNINIQKCYSRDKTVQEYGRCLINFCKSSGYRIMN